jgi:membrane-associated protease RseP (regulator of RpoE activity)
MANTDAAPQAERSPSDTPAPAERPRSGLVRLGVLVALVVYLGVRGGLPWLFIVGSLVLMVFLHELGHFLTARWAGMKVTQFFLGFGPRVWSVQRGETEYGLKAIPAGAYVKVIGMYGMDEVDPADEPRTYRQKKYYQRVVMAAAGSTMHFLLALALIYAVLVGVGRQQIDNWSVAVVSPGSAAEVAGLQAGDRLLRVDGRPVEDWSRMREVIAPLQGRTVEVVLVRDGTVQTVEATIGAHPQRPTEGQLGVGPDFPLRRVGPFAAVSETLSQFAAITTGSVKGLLQLFTPSGLGSFARQVAEGRVEQPAEGGGATAAPAEDETRFLSIYGAARVGADLTREGPGPALGFLAMLNIFIGLFNLVPLLPFDGGHIAIATYERVRELVARNGRRHFTDVTRLLPLTYAVVGLLVMIGLSSFYLDFVNPVSLP